MQRTYAEVEAALRGRVRTWLVTGVAGFIGSSLLERLLGLDQTVVGLDDLSTGYRSNLDEVRSLVGESRWSRFRFLEGDIRILEVCRDAVSGVDFVLHEAALGSVPRSIADPTMSNSVNVDGFLNMLVAARDDNVESFVYAASSSTYGDHQALPKIEERIGVPLSPYAVTKYVNELYADVFARAYGFRSIGLRYFNVFGPRQDPNGAYAAVIPKWVTSMLRGGETVVNGDGETSRDFCFIDNVVQANLLAATARAEAFNMIYNIGLGERITLNQLHDTLTAALGRRGVDVASSATYRDFRPGDVRHSEADISKAKRLLGYRPTHKVRDGLDEVVRWYQESSSDVRNASRRSGAPKIRGGQLEEQAT